MTSPTRWLTRALVLAMLMSPASRAQERAKPAPEEQTGLKVGEKAPKFTLKDQAGQDRSLDDLLKKGKVALVFYRSADWWPYCRTQLVQLQRDLKSLEAAGVQVVGISYDAPAILKKFSDQSGITFPLLSDPESRTIDAYHIRNDAAKGKAQGVPNPGTFLLDRDGVIRAKLFLEGFRERHKTEALVEAAKAVP